MLVIRLLHHTRTLSQISDNRTDHAEYLQMLIQICTRYFRNRIHTTKDRTVDTFQPHPTCEDGAAASPRTRPAWRNLADAALMRVPESLRIRAREMSAFRTPGKGVRIEGWSQGPESKSICPEIGVESGSRVHISCSVRADQTSGRIHGFWMEERIRGPGSRFQVP